jgi:hypothetical protein
VLVSLNNLKTYYVLKLITNETHFLPPQEFTVGAGVVAHTCIPSYLEAKIRGILGQANESKITRAK